MSRAKQMAMVRKPLKRGKAIWMPVATRSDAPDLEAAVAELRLAHPENEYQIVEVHG